MSLRSVEEVFPKVQARLDNIDPNNRKVVHVFKINILKDGEVAKTMILDLVEVKFYEGDDDAECTLSLEDDLLADLFQKKADLGEALKNGEIQAEGSLEILAKLAEAMKNKN